MTRRPQIPMKGWLLLALGVVVLCLQTMPLFAKKIPAEQVSISTPVYVPAESFDPQLGRYSYEVSWNGIPAGSIELELNRTGDNYEIRTSAQTSKGIDLLFKLRYEAETLVSAKTLFPKHSVSVSRTNSKKKITELEFLPGGEILSIRKDDEGKQRTMKFDPGNFTLEPYSVAFLALSQEWKVGESRRFDMFSGKSRYLIEFTAVDQTEVTVNGKTRSSIVLRPSVRKLTDTGEDADDKKLREARIYISADQSREILKISSDLLFGSVDTEMVNFSSAVPYPPAAKNREHFSGQESKSQNLESVMSWDGPSGPVDFSLIVQRYPLIFVEFLTCSSLFLFSHDYGEISRDMGWIYPPVNYIRQSFLVYSEVTAPNRSGRKAAVSDFCLYSRDS